VLERRIRRGGLEEGDSQEGIASVILIGIEKCLSVGKHACMHVCTRDGWA